METNEIIRSVKNRIQTILRNKKYKKELKEHNARVTELQDLMKCSGELNQCKQKYISTIRQQQRQVREGREAGFFTAPQEQILLDAAIGYLVVDDAAYALHSMSSYNDMIRAYAMLDAISKDVTDKKGGLSKIKKEETYEQNDLKASINTEDILRRYSPALKAFEAELFVTRDIEGCLKKIRIAANSGAYPQQGQSETAYDQQPYNTSNDYSYQSDSSWARSGTESSSDQENQNVEDYEKRHKMFSGMTPPIGIGG